MVLCMYGFMVLRMYGFMYLWFYGCPQDRPPNRTYPALSPQDQDITALNPTGPRISC